MRASRAKGARQQLLVAIVLLIFTSHITFQGTRSLLPQFRRCSQRHKAHSAILAAALTLPNASVPESIHIAQRRAASKFLLASVKHSSCAPVRISRLTRRRLDYSLHSRLAVDGTLLYLMSLVGFREHLAVEVDGSPAPALLSATLAIHRNCRVIALHESWAGYDLSHRFYEPVAADRARAVEIRPRVLEARFAGKESFSDVLHREQVAGTIDVLSLLSSGSELAILKTMRTSNVLRPRLLIASYQDFLGSHVRASRSVTGGSKDDMNVGPGRLDIGMSIAILVAVAKDSGFRLIWCTSAAPLAFFVDERSRVGHGVLATITPKRCISERDTGLLWRRDMEAQWDLAQQYKWNKFT